MKYDKSERNGPELVCYRLHSDSGSVRPIHIPHISVVCLFVHFELELTRITVSVNDDQM